MKNVSIKICGITSPRMAEEVVALGCEYLGMVFYPRSPRNVTPAQAGEITRAAARRLKTVAVTVDADDALIDAIVKAAAPDAIQLHGNEPPERLPVLRARHPSLSIIKAISVRTSDDIAAARRYEPLADMLLFDAKPPQGSDLPGGNGLAFDWMLLQNRDIGLPWFLSGGLNSENVGEALRMSGAKMVDISSSVESAPGVKDAALMRAFVEAARA